MYRQGWVDDVTSYCRVAIGGVGSLARFALAFNRSVFFGPGPPFSFCPCGADNRPVRSLGTPNRLLGYKWELMFTARKSMDG